MGLREPPPTRAGTCSSPVRVASHLSPTPKQLDPPHRRLVARQSHLCSHDALCASHAEMIHKCSRHLSRVQELSSGYSLASCCRPLMRRAALHELLGGATGRFNLVLRVPVCRCWVVEAAVCRGLLSNLGGGPRLRAFNMVGSSAEAGAGPQEMTVRAHARRQRRGFDWDRPGALSSGAVVRPARLHRPCWLCGVDWSAPIGSASLARPRGVAETTRR